MRIHTLLALALTAAPLLAQTPEQILKRFPNADVDKDGRLSEQEMRAVQERMKRERGPQGAPKPTPTAAAAQYGPHERNVLDFWKAETTAPAPVLVFIHGGGFVGGSKDGVSGATIDQCLKLGVSFASISYRYSTQAIYPAPMLDGARAIQFLRSKAKEWNIDPARIGAYGGSAGAGISMWVGFHEDLKKPDSADPIERESTRLLCIATQGGQSTYDPLVIKEWIGGRAWEHPALLKLFGAETAADFEKPEIRKLATDSAALTHLSKDDPPIHMTYSEADGPLPADAKPGQGIHHPIFGHKLKARMDALGIQCIYQHTKDGPQQSPTMIDFFRDHLKPERK